MANSQLAGRFLANWPAPFTPQAELVYEGPRRQRELLALGRQQVQSQWASAKAVANSNIAAADIIANEISRQTSALDASLRDYSDRISLSVMDAADQMSLAVEVLGDRLCAYLGEIKWQLAQQTETLSGILQALRESRSNEARQLVEQGVRHYANEQYDRAEERFQQALKKDTTDYQVLMNLGLVAIQKGQAKEALNFFEDALRLPSGLDRLSKNRALLASARLYYATGAYNDALVKALQANTLADPSQVDEIFMLGTYAALAGQIDECLKRLEQAIRVRSELFGKAAVEPNLEAHRPLVLALLSRMATEALEAVNRDVRTARDMLAMAAQHEESAMCTDERQRAQKAIESIGERIPRASYSELVGDVRKEVGSVTQAIRLIIEAESTAAESRRIRPNLPKLAAREEDAKRHLGTYGDPSSPWRMRYWFLWHFVSFIVVAGLMPRNPSTAQMVLFMIYPWAGLAIWPFLQHLTWTYADSVVKRQETERSERTAAVSAATKARAEVFARVVGFEKRALELLAQADALTRL